jgi:hypothetical protein
MRKLEPKVAPYFAGDVTMTIGKAAESRFFGGAPFFGAVQENHRKPPDLEVSAVPETSPDKPWAVM